MDEILITNTIGDSKIIISIDNQDETLNFSSVDIDVSRDIDVNPLVIKLSEIIELKKEIKYDFEDDNNLLENSPKLCLVKQTLSEIYDQFNNVLKNSESCSNDVN